MDMSHMSQPHQDVQQFEPAAACEPMVPDTFEPLTDYFAPRSYVGVRFVILFPLSSRRYAVQEDSAVFASSPHEEPIMQWLIERVGITTGRGGRRYVVVLDLNRQRAWRAAYAEAIEFLHTVNPR